MKTVFLMLKTRKRRKTAVMLALLLTPAATYAVYALLLFSFDSFRGDGLMLYQYIFESRLTLANQVLADGRQALPVFYAAGLLMWIVIQLIYRYSGRRSVMPAAVIGVLTGFAVTAVFVDITPGAMVPAALSGMLMALVLALVVRPFAPQA